MVGDIVPYEVVAYCHVGHGRSSLYQNSIDGNFDESVKEIKAGIFKECSAFFEDNWYDEIPVMLEVTADCEARTLGGLKIAVEELISPGGAGAKLLDFLRLCPNTSRQMAREACEAGEDSVCGAFEREAICQADEEVVFGCKIEGRDKYVSICEKNGNRSYVYGKVADNPELRISQRIPREEFIAPSIMPSHPEQFTFHNKGYHYRVTTIGGGDETNKSPALEVFRDQIGAKHLVAAGRCEPW